MLVPAIAPAAAAGQGRRAAHPTTVRKAVRQPSPIPRLTTSRVSGPGPIWYARRAPRNALDRSAGDLDRARHLVDARDRGADDGRLALELAGFLFPGLGELQV